MASLAFVACVDPGPLEAQTVLLCASIRTFAGRHRDAPIFVLQPRTSDELSSHTIAALRAAGAEHRRERINERFPSFPFAKKTYAMAWAQRHVDADVLVFVDSDSLIVTEPTELELADGAAAAVRPVNVKNIGSTGADDPNDAFWQAVHARCGSVPSPIVETTLSRERIHGYWNSGLVAARRDAGVLETWPELLERLIDGDVLPRGGSLNKMEQVALTAVLSRVPTTVLDRRHNYPLPLRPDLPDPWRSKRLDELVHVHHFRFLHRPGALEHLEPPLPRDCPIAAWLEPYLPLEPTAFADAPRQHYRLASTG